MRSTEEQREYVAQMVLQLRGGRAGSRRELASQMRLSPSTAGQYVDQLIGGGFLVETGLGQGALGRPKRLLSLRREAGWFAGIELNAERVQAVRVNFAGEVELGKVVLLEAEKGAKAVLAVVGGVLREWLEVADGPLLGVGLGAPGVVDPVRGVAVHYSFIEGWRALRLRERFSAHWGVPVTVENNLRAIACAERWFGGGRDVEDYLILGPRSGVGVAMVQGGRVVTGAHHAAGEIGRMSWPMWGCKQEVHDGMTAPAVYRRLLGRSARARVPRDLRRGFAGLAGVEGEGWRTVIADYAALVSGLQLMMDPEKIFLHGPLTALGPRFCEEVTMAVREGCAALAEGGLDLQASVLGDDAGALGAAGLAMEAWVPTPW